jgi:FkbM family methyltransferase
MIFDIGWRSVFFIKPVLRAIRRLRFRKLHDIDVVVPIVELGSDYGSWPVIKGTINSGSVVYSFGIGEDLSFDLEAMKRYRCEIEAFDPTPRSLDWVFRQDLPSGLRVHPFGLANSTRTLRFAAPENEAHVSYSAATVPEGQHLVDLPVHPIDWFMEELGHSHVDYLKMDIEGSEYEVVTDLVSKGVMPGQVCIEFHHGMYGYSEYDTCKAVNQLKTAGYLIHFISDTGREYGFHRP